MKSFGGSWTEQKLNTFIKYVEAYLTILNKFKKNIIGKQYILMDLLVTVKEKIIIRMRVFLLIYLKVRIRKNYLFTKVQLHEF